MQVSLNLHNKRNFITNKTTKNSFANSVSAREFYPTVLISFSGNKKLNQVAFITSECGTIVSTGGVGTVAQDFAQGKVFNEKMSFTLPDGKVVQGPKPIVLLPYYNGFVTQEFDEVANLPSHVSDLLPDYKLSTKYKAVDVLKTKDGTPIFTKEILQPKGFSVYDLKPDQYNKLELIAEKEMDMAGSTKRIAAYRVKDAKNMDAIMIFTEATARMRKPYDGAGGGYSSKLRPLGEPDPYAEYCKALVKLMPDLEKIGVNPRHLISNDAQCGYIAEYINQEIKAGNSYWKGVTNSLIMHNGGIGYQQRQDPKNMSLSFISNDDVLELSKDPVWNSLTDMEKEAAYRKSVQSFMTTDNKTTPFLVSLKHCDNGSIVTHCSTVAPGYAEAISVGNGVADGMKTILRKMYKEGTFSGILNGLDTNNFGPEFLFNGGDLKLFDIKSQVFSLDPKADATKIELLNGLSVEAQSNISDQLAEIKKTQETVKNYADAKKARDAFAKLKKEIMENAMKKASPELKSKLEEAQKTLAETAKGKDDKAKIAAEKALKKAENKITANISDDLKNKLAKAKADADKFSKQWNAFAELKKEIAQVVIKERIKMARTQISEIQKELEKSPNNQDLEANLKKVKKELSKLKALKAENLPLANDEILARKFAKINGVSDGKSFVESVTSKKDSSHVSYFLKPFEKFSINDSAEDIIAIKQRNTNNLLTRIYLHKEAGLPVEYVTQKNTAKIFGGIGKDVIKSIKDGENITAFVAWGRADLQKAPDNTIDAYLKFISDADEVLNNKNASEAEIAAAKKAKNSVLIMGGELKDTYLEKDIRAKISVAEKQYPGHFVYIDGFAPNKVLSTGGQFPVVPSRWAPCELTDLEAMRYGANPIVAGIEGLADKNFDIRTDNEHGTGLVTKYNNNTDVDKIDISKLSKKGQAAIKEYRKERADLITKLRNELKTIQVELSDGTIRNLNEAEIDYRLRWAISFEEMNGKLKDLKMKAADSLVVEDLAKLMSASMALSDEQRKQAVINAMELSNNGARWINNGILQKDGKDAISDSAANLYIRKHIFPSKKVASSSDKVGYRSLLEVVREMFKYKYDELKLKAAAECDAALDGEKSLFQNPKNFSDIVPLKPNTFVEKYFNKQTAVAFLGIAAIGALACYLFKSDDKDSKKSSNAYIA